MQGWVIKAVLRKNSPRKKRQE